MAEAATCVPSAPTIRISNIPIQISRDDLHRYLQDLDSQLGALAANTVGHPYISLAPEASEGGHQRFQVATVTLSRLIHPLPSGIRLGPDGAGFEATVDTHFRGLTPLSSPKEPKIDIIAVTGLAGHAFGSWRSPEGYGMWLRDFLPSDTEEHSARIFTYGYNTTLTGSHSHAKILDFSNQFIEAVDGARSDCSSRPLILIGHSLGGLVIKEAIIQCFNRKKSPLGPAIGILFFSVPHKGLADTSLTSMVRGQPNENLVLNLCEGSQYLNVLDRFFGYHMNLRGMGTNIISFYETDETPSVKEVRPGKWMRSGPCVRMVTEESVKHAAVGGQGFPMDANHSSIVKFKDRSDQKYQLVCSKLLGIARQLLIAPPETQVPCKERTELCEWLYPGVVDNKHKEISSKRQEGTGGWLLADDRFISWKGGSGPRLLWGCGIPGAGKTFLSSLVIDVLDASSRGVATEWGSTILINYLLSDEGAGISSDGTGTPLHVAAAENLVGLVRFWLQKGVAVDTRGAYSRGTPLSWAIRQGSIDAAQVLLSSGADVIAALQAPGWKGEEARDANMLGLLFEFGLEMEPKWRNKTYLQVAISHNYSAVLGLLLRKGVKIHARDKKGRTPLHKAVLHQSTEIVRLLLQHGYGGHQEEEDEGEDDGEDEGEDGGEDEGEDEEDEWDASEIKDRCAHCGDCTHRTPVGRLVDAADCFGATPLHDAADFGEPDILRLLLSHGIDGTSSGNVRAPRVHEHAAAINARDREGLTALSHAANEFNKHRTVMIQMLVDAGADLTVPPDSDESNTWLHRAGEMGNVPLLKAALDAGVDPHTRGNDNMSPLHSAAYGASLEAVSLLMARGLTVDLRDGEEKTPLHRARGAATIALLLERGACTRSTDIHGSSPLHCRLDSAYHNDRWDSAWRCDMIREDVELLIKGGADVNARNTRGETPLCLAASLGYAGLVSLLLESGADMGALDVDQMSALHHAATSMEVLGPHAISVLVECGMSIDAVDINQRTPLHHAVLAPGIWGTEKKVDLLVGKGASVEPRDSAGFTPLRYLVDGYIDHSTTRVARTLIQAGADVSTVYDGGVSLLHLAAERCSKEMLALLLDGGADIHARDSKQRTPLHHSMHNAEDKDDGEKVIFLVERGAHINAKDINGNTPLQYLLDPPFYSAMPNDTMEALISLGADINVVGNSHKSPLHLAAQGGNRQLLALLLDAGADIHAHDFNQQTPLHHMARGFDAPETDVIRYLADNGANVNARDLDGQTLLHLLMDHRWSHHSIIDVAKILLSFGPEVNSVNDTHQNISLFHLAARGGSQDMLPLLLDAGADIHARDSNGRTVLHHTVLAHSEEWANLLSHMCDYECPWRGVAEMLIFLGANVNAIDKDQNSPLHLAAQEGEKNSELLVRLVDAGADRHARNCNQETPLDIAITRGFSARITDMLADRSRCAEYCPANQVKTGDPHAEMMEIDDASCAIEAPGQYPEEEAARKRRYSTAFPTRSN